VLRQSLVRRNDAAEALTAVFAEAVTLNVSRSPAEAQGFFDRTAKRRKSWAARYRYLKKPKKLTLDVDVKACSVRNSR
jgi:hypothetical protein